MSHRHPTAAQIRYRAEQARRKKEKRMAELAADIQRCPARHIHTEPWDCGCSWGCDMCSCRTRCIDCGKIS